MKSVNKIKKLSLFLTASILILQLVGCAGSSTSEAPPPAPPSYPIASTVSTTLERTVIPTSPDPTDVSPNDVADYSKYHYGEWREGAGLALVKDLSIMAPGYTGASVTNRASLLRFFSMSDIHITDVQSPAQNLYWGLNASGNSSSYSPVILYSTQVLDAAVQTVNALNAKRSFDFGIFLGDAVNAGQYNELRWYIDVIDGRTINPNSDPKSTASTDYMRPFKAAGLDGSIPWYQVLGNHDHFYSGAYAQTGKTLDAYVGQDILSTGLITDPNSIAETGYSMGVVDGSTPYGTVIGAGKETDIPPPPKVNANPDRRFIARTNWISEFFNTTSSPIGHGFSKDDISSACYTLEPKASLPLKLIVLDDTQNDDITGPNGANGSLDKERYDWLKDELQKGQDQGKLMIVAAHVPIGVTPSLWDASTSVVTEAALIAQLHTYPNLVMWMSGHRHYNVVTAIPSSDPVNKPEEGFWVVETASTRDYPQQFRTFDIFRNSDNTISIVTVNVDPAVRQGTPAATSRVYSIAAAQIFTGLQQTQQPPYNPIGTVSGAYNAELVKELSPAMKVKIQNYGTLTGN